MPFSRPQPENGPIRSGPRSVIASIVGIWSVLTALTGAAWSYVSMLIIRFLFGAGEAGAFPSLAKVVYNWFPVKERGIIQGINFSGSRIGAAFALPLVAIIIGRVGWRMSFLIFGGIGLVFAPSAGISFSGIHPKSQGQSSKEEKKYILENREQSSGKDKSHPEIRNHN